MTLPTNRSFLKRGRWTPNLSWQNYGFDDGAVLRQLTWERERAMSRMRDLGFTYTKVGEWFGVHRNVAKYHVEHHRSSVGPPIMLYFRPFSIEDSKE